MNVILAMVMSLDGKITKWGNPHIHEWTSKEDQEHFANLVQDNTAIIMGRTTYSTAKYGMKHIVGKIRVIVTKSPKIFENEAIPGQLEFTADIPKMILEKLEKQGHSRVLLAGGGEINALFLKENLVNEIWLTIEPKLFGMGNSLVAEEKLDVDLKLKNIERLNEKGTILLRYMVTH